jgi:NADP-dependent 3-hydroxy acid dehydrogenase YdfG
MTTCGQVIITGASSGIGLATVRRFAQAGYPILALARRADRLEELAQTYGRAAVKTAVLDVRDPTAVASVFEAALASGPRVAALVNNAGLSLGLGPLDRGCLEDWDTMIETNIRGMLHCTRAVLPAMQAAGAGHIINIGSLAGRHPYFGGNVYAATKAFVNHLSDNLRVDLGGSGIRVTCIAPGMVKSEFALVRFNGDADRASALYDGISPMQPDDIADAVFWAFHTPPRVNVNYIELMPTDQPFGLALRANAAAPVKAER